MLLCLGVACAPTAPPVVRLAGFFPLDGAWSGGRSVVPAVRFALEDIAADPTLLRHTRLEVDCVSPNATCHGLHDTECSALAAVERLIQVQSFYQDKIVGSSDPPLVGVVGAGCSQVCLIMQQLLNVWRLPMLSYACSSPALSQVEAYPYFMRTAPDDTVLTPAWVELCRRFNWTRIGIVMERGLLFEGTASHFASLVAQQHDPAMTLVSEAFERGEEAAAVATLRQHRLQIIFFACYAPQARALFRALYAAGMYGPGYAYIGLGWLEEGWWDGDPAVLAVAKYHWIGTRTPHMCMYMYMWSTTERRRSERAGPCLRMLVVPLPAL